MFSSRSIKRGHLEEIWQRFQLMNRSDILKELRELIDTFERVSADGRQHPVTEEEICAALPRLPETKRETYLAVLEKAGHLKSCYGGHDARRTGWRLNPIGTS